MCTSHQLLPANEGVSVRSPGDPAIEDRNATLVDHSPRARNNIRCHPLLLMLLIRAVWQPQSDRFSPTNSILARAHSLVRKSLQPNDACEQHLRQSSWSIINDVAGLGCESAAA